MQSIPAKSNSQNNYTYFIKRDHQMATNSRRKFLRNAGLGLTGFTILPIISGAKAAENFSLDNGTQTIEDEIDLWNFNNGKSSNPYFRNQPEDLSLKQYAEIFEEGDFVLQNENISRSIDWKHGFVKTASLKINLPEKLTRWKERSFSLTSKEFHIH